MKNQNILIFIIIKKRCFFFLFSSFKMFHQKEQLQFLTIIIIKFSFFFLVLHDEFFSIIFFVKRKQLQCDFLISQIQGDFQQNKVVKDPSRDFFGGNFFKKMKGKTIFHPQIDIIFYSCSDRTQQICCDTASLLVRTVRRYI